MEEPCLTSAPLPELFPPFPKDLLTRGSSAVSVPLRETTDAKHLQFGRLGSALPCLSFLTWEFLSLAKLPATTSSLAPAAGMTSA